MNSKVILCILDGWGIGLDNKEFNGLNVTKHWPELLKKYPYTQLEASEAYVGLPEKQMGNSEVGHMTIGLGRVLMQDLPKIDQQFARGDISNNPNVLKMIEQLKSKKCHLLGLLSPGGVHSHMNHMIGAAKLLANAGITVYIHGFLDGRDTPPKSAEGYVGEFLKEIEGYSNIHLASLGGRYYAMDRDNRWERIELAYESIVNADALKFSNAVQFIQKSYDIGITDEFIRPAAHETYQGMQDGDGLWMINFRSDRVRQILSSLLIKDFSNFDRKRVVAFAQTLAMNDYAEYLSPLIPSIFNKDIIDQSLGEVIANAGLKQLRVAETEKYAHVTFFLNGGREIPFNGEERVMIPSPNVATYDLQPEMSAPEVTKTVCDAMERDDLALIVVNYANTDMVGHTGVTPAIKQAVTCVDNCIKILEQKALEYNWVLLITADHGNVECMVDVDGVTPHTAHTCNPVPFLLINGSSQQLQTGTLADVAPTILDIMSIAKPFNMSGKSLLC